MLRYRCTVISHIESEHPELGPYKCMLTLTRVLGSCVAAKKKPVRGTGWKPQTWVTGRPKTDNILLVRWSVSCTTLPHLPCNPQLHNKDVILIIIYSTSTNQLSIFQNFLQKVKAFKLWQKNSMIIIIVLQESISTIKFKE